MADPALGIARRRPLAVGDPLECDPLEGDPLEGDPFGEPLEGVRGREGGEAAAEPLVEMPLTLTRRGEGGEGGEQEVVTLRVHKGQDASEQVFAFCAANGLHSADEVSKLGGLVSGRLEEAGHAREEATSAAALVARGARQRR